VRDERSPVVATAIHAGHDLRPSIESNMQLDEATRFREEDPFTDRLTAVGGTTIVAHRSRFEVDLNRPREASVYGSPEDAWGLRLWRAPLPDSEVTRSRQLYDDFYATLRRQLDGMAARGPFVVLDLHSYNHRRDGADVPPAPVEANPDVNIGTGSVDQPHWRGLVERFIDDLARQEVAGHRLDVRENIRFRGGELSRWVNQSYGSRGCALAIEFKKLFMDEWTGALDEKHLGELQHALADTVQGLTDELRCLTSR
jgi:N-formylglutamate amidohydrolase